MSPAVRLRIQARLFQELMVELARRGRGRRESGAFLLADRAQPASGPVRVVAVAYYDDLDAGCLTGAIDFGADGYSALAELCRRRGLRVVADIHTHPGPGVGQSRIDAAHPMVALDGHVALIAPHYAAGVAGAAQLGVHVRAGGGWTSFHGPAAAAVLAVETAETTRRRRGTRLLARLARAVADLFGNRRRP